MVAAASIVVAAGTVSGVISATGEGPDAPEARPVPSASPRPVPLPAVPSASPSATSATVSASPSVRPRRSSASASESPQAKKTTVSARLYRHPASRVIDWVRAHPGDPRRPVIESRIADQPAAVWFADWSPDTVTARVRAVTSGGAAEGRVPVVVPYAIPGRDCGGHSEGGAPDLEAYDDWIDRFAAGLGSGEVVVILEPDSVAQADCLSAGERAARFASLARAGRVFKEAGPRARVYYDAGHSGWHSPAKQADLLRRAGAASSASSDGVFSNVSNFHGTADEIAYDRAVLDALGGTHLGAVIDTSRNGNGAPADGEWCDPAGRTLGRAPTLSTGEPRIDAYLWVKLPGESDGCKGAPGTFSPSYAYDLAR
ncbi:MULTISPECIES: glycoside hydrolase family 6 protein [unclassified Streptomyces]|uniref:glycoside hydrolase family 6 protein n=1 Tax=unclassified Streptomyces TaxID=2593676 RepID=UPI000A3730A9|nr:MULTISPECIES: glycoside hydrolase family 6 protein [unclassified Streptomyces]MDH3037101.1 glycoside hydrolase family 6 protein [Streptomyces sp. TRM75561]